MNNSEDFKTSEVNQEKLRRCGLNLKKIQATRKYKLR